MIQHAVEIGRPGAMLRGTVYLPTGVGRAGRVPTVLMLHGFTGNRIGNGFMFVSLARALNDRGMAAVTFDFLHSGESDGAFDRTLVSGQVADARDMTRWLGGQPFVDRSRMAVLGHSLGALVACCLTAREPGTWAARVLLAPTTAEHLARFAKQRDDQGLATVGVHALHPGFFDDLRTLDPLADAARPALPTLLIEAAADELVPAAVSSRYLDALVAAGRPARHHAIADADHAFSRPAPRRALIDLATDWLGRRFAGAPGLCPPPASALSSAR